MNPQPTPTPHAEDPCASRRRWLGAAGAACLGAGLGGCGGGDEPGTRQPQDERRRPLGGVDGGGTGAPMRAMLSASIAVASPLTVGGTVLDTTGSTLVDADGHTLSSTDLRPGRTARVDVEGTRALRVELGEQLLGPLAAVDLAEGRLQLLGQTVRVTGSTRYDATLAGGLAALRPGQPLRVWGQLDTQAGHVVATRVEGAPAGFAARVRGVLRQLDRASGQVRIGALEAWLADSALVPADAAAGQVVRATLQLAGTLVVVQALRGDATRPPEGLEAAIEGRVTDLSDAGRRFAVDGVAVDATAAAASATLRAGDRVQVQGRVLGSVLQAREVELVVEELYEAEGTIDSADAATRRFTLRGLTVHWDASTRFEGGGPSLLAARRKVAVKGRLSADRRHLQAQHIHVEG